MSGEGVLPNGFDLSKDRVYVVVGVGLFFPPGVPFQAVDSTPSMAMMVPAVPTDDPPEGRTVVPMPVHHQTLVGTVAEVATSVHASLAYALSKAHPSRVEGCRAVAGADPSVVTCYNGRAGVVPDFPLEHAAEDGGRLTQARVVAVVYRWDKDALAQAADGSVLVRPDRLGSLDELIANLMALREKSGEAAA